MSLGPVALWGYSSRLHHRGHRRSARVIKLINYMLFKAILPPEATMASVPHLMHRGLGVVIHPTTTFGEGVTLGHQVTVAASPVDDLGRIYPVVIEDRVFIGTGAILLARTGPLTVGAGAVVGAGSVVVRDVLPGSRVFGNPAQPKREA